MQPESNEGKSKEQLEKEAASEAAKEQFSSTFTKSLGDVFAPLSDLPNQPITSEEGSPEREKMVKYIGTVIDHIGKFMPPSP
jgi:hypothetical protein